MYFIKKNGVVEDVFWSDTQLEFVEVILEILNKFLDFIRESSIVTLQQVHYVINSCKLKWILPEKILDELEKERENRFLKVHDRHSVLAQ